MSKFKKGDWIIRCEGSRSSYCYGSNTIIPHNTPLLVTRVDVGERSSDFTFLYKEIERYADYVNYELAKWTKSPLWRLMNE